MLSFRPISEVALSTLQDKLSVAFTGTGTFTSVNSEGISICAATQDYISFLSDTPSGTPYNGTLDRLPSIERTIINSDGFDGMSITAGSFGLINVGGYDVYLRNVAFDAREVVFHAGTQSQLHDSFIEVARFLAVGNPDADGQYIVWSLEDKSFKLDVAAQKHYYAGTGDLEGGLDLAGKAKPLVLGRALNITPAPLITAELVLQVSDGAVSAIIAVYDNGYPLDFSADYATPALLRAATIAGGSYATCIAYGLIRVGAPYQQITCDVRGDASGTGYVETTGTIIRRVIVLSGAITDPTDLDTDSFANIEIDQPAPIGYFIETGSTITVKEVITALAKGIRAACGFTRLGKFQIKLFTAPSGTPFAEYGDTEIIDVDMEPLPSSFDPPPVGCRAIYERNWTILQTPYAGVVTLNPTRAAWLSTPYKFASTTDAAGLVISAQHLRAQPPIQRESYFALSADALAQANSDFTLMTSEYRMYRIQLKVPPFLQDICQTVRISLGDARYGLSSAGRLLRIASISDNPEDNTMEIRAVG